MRSVVLHLPQEQQAGAISCVTASSEAREEPDMNRMWIGWESMNCRGPDEDQMKNQLRTEAKSWEGPEKPEWTKAKSTDDKSEITSYILLWGTFQGLHPSHMERQMAIMGNLNYTLDLDMALHVCHGGDIVFATWRIDVCEPTTRTATGSKQVDLFN